MIKHYADLALSGRKPGGMPLAGVVALLCLVSTPWAHAAEPVLIDESSQSWEVTPNCDYLKEPTPSLTPEAVSQPPWRDAFKPVQCLTANFGLTQDKYWYSFRLRNTGSTARDLRLEFNNPRLGIVEVYQPKAGGGFTVQRAGASLPFDLRPVPSRDPVFIIKLDAHEERTVFASAWIRGSHVFSLRLWEADAFVAHYMRHRYELGIFFGVLMAIALQSFIIFVRLHDRLFLQNAIFVCLCLLYELSFHGIAHQYLWPNASWWNDRSIMCMMAFAMAFAFILSRAILSTQRWTPRWDFCMRVMVVVCLLVPLGKLTDSLWANILAHSVGILGPLVIVAAAVSCWRRGYRPAILFLMAWGTMLVGALMIALGGLDILPNTWLIRNGLHIGIVLAPLLFTLGLADRVRMLETSHRVELERLVAERTRDLAKRTNELQEALDRVKTLHGLIPICSRCKKVRDDHGYWGNIERYLHEHSNADFTHGICPECMRVLYGSEVSERVEDSLKLQLKNT